MRLVVVSGTVSRVREIVPGYVLNLRLLPLTCSTDHVPPFYFNFLSLDPLSHLPVHLNYLHDIALSLHRTQKNSRQIQGERLVGSLSAIKARAPVLGGNFGVWGGLFSTFDCAVKGYRQKEDPWNAIISGFLTGGSLALRCELLSFFLFLPKECRVPGTRSFMLTRTCSRSQVCVWISSGLCHPFGSV